MGTYRCICGGESRNCVRCGGTGLVTKNPAPVVRPIRNFAQAARENPLPTPAFVPTKKDAPPRRRTPREPSIPEAMSGDYIDLRLKLAINQFERSRFTNLTPFARLISFVTTSFLFGNSNFDPVSLEPCPLKRTDFFAYPDVVDAWAISTKSVKRLAARRLYAVEVRKIVTLARNIYEENIQRIPPNPDVVQTLDKSKKSIGRQATRGEIKREIKKLSTHALELLHRSHFKSG